MSELPIDLYDAQGARALDDTTIHVHGIPGYELMCRAGRAAYSTIRQYWPDMRRLAVLCGSGNNGGDGYVVAALAAEDGLDVRLIAFGAPRSEDARRALATAGRRGLQPVQFDDFVLEDCDLIVDALLGTGLNQAPRGDIADAIEFINACSVPKFALDVPSGLNADNGDAPGSVVEAWATSTFIGLKVGLLTGQGPEYAGTVHFHDLGVPGSVYANHPPVARRIDETQVRAWLPRRKRCAHKGTQGHVVLIGGNHGMTGALRIASETAARCGAGLVTAVTRSCNTSLINVGQPEIMVRAGDEISQLKPVLEGRSALGIGPGLGQDTWASTVCDYAVSMNVPMVIDADGLNQLAKRACQHEDWILTPHPGEAARLLGCATTDIARDRLEASRAIQKRYGGVCVLKGCGTVIAAENALYICDRGNPGMATGGMGDCLTGVLTALLGQGLPPLHAAVCGVWLHASAADLEARQNGMVGIMASDLYPRLRRLMDGQND